MSDGDFDVEDMTDPFEKQLEARAAAAQERSRLESLSRCEECDEPIPERRRTALPGVRLCVECQHHRDADAARRAAIGGGALRGFG